MATNRDEVENLYHQIYTCEKCFDDPLCNIKKDSQKVHRKVEVLEKAMESGVFIISQALARSTQRISGLPYVLGEGRKKGELSPTGKILDEKFLKLFDCTINPSNIHSGNQKYVYSSDIVQCYPGGKKTGDGDRKPTSREIENCSDWLDKELKFVSPSTIITIGSVATKQILKKYGNITICDLKDEWGKQHNFKIHGKLVGVFAVLHPVAMVRKDEIYKETANKIKQNLISDFT